jgi:hypothetical protein
VEVEAELGLEFAEGADGRGDGLFGEDGGEAVFDYDGDFEIGTVRAEE